MSTPMDILKQTGTITGLFQQDMELEEPFIDFAMRFGHIPGTTTLMSGTDLDCARVPYAGNPALSDLFRERQPYDHLLCNR